MNVTICIEPNSKKYNCNYLNTISDVGNIVRRINKDNIKMMVDLGNAIMEKDDLDIIYNIDVAEENMTSFINPNNKNYEFRNILKNINYNKKINLEMLLTPNNELTDLIVSLNNFINIYSN
jgi:glycosidase